MSLVAPTEFPVAALKRFHRHLGELGQSDLGMSSAAAATFAEEACALLSEDHDFTRLSTHLESSGIRERWNRACALRRAAEIGNWTAPHVRGRLMDLLCGDGRVGENLARRGFDTTLIERQETYGVDRAAHSAPFTLFEEDGTLPEVDTVLLSTVLHHEPDADALLKRAAAAARRRLILVENCLEAAYPAEFQEFMDLFFNHCLNHNDLDSPMSHRTPDDWIEACAFYGSPIVVERKERLPGIPLSHHLIVIERR